jgi:putative tryptophan/tyrosine transport system substrate-binding protein
MDRRRFLLTSLAGALTAPPTSWSQVAGSMRTVGWLSPFKAPTPEHPPWSAVRAKFRDLGWIVGLNLNIEPAFAEEREDRLPELAAELVRKRVEVIAANGPAAVLAAAGATKTIPIVFFHIGFPVELGFVQSLARPGGNITGVTSHAGMAETAKQLQVLRELAPGATRLAWIATPTKNPGTGGELTPLTSFIEEAARGLGFQMRSHRVFDLRDLEAAFAAILASGAQALSLVGSLFTWLERQRIVDFANRNRLPGAFPSKSWVEVGGLVAYGSVQVAWPLQAVVYIDRILRGAQPATLPVELPTRFELSINRRTAKALGLTIPPGVLAAVDQIFE